MTPPMIPNKIAYETGPMTFFKTSHPSNPPRGSKTPERNAHKKACSLEPVAFTTGTATARPSGMLWMAIAMPRVAPKDGSAKVATNVARPSGKLCNAMATPLNAAICTISALSFPLSFLGVASAASARGCSAGCSLVAAGAGQSGSQQYFFSTAWEKNSSPAETMMPPKKTSVARVNACGSSKPSAKNSSSAFEKISWYDTCVITPAESAKQVAKSQLLWMGRQKAREAPTVVASPAPSVIKKAVSSSPSPFPSANLRPMLTCDMCRAAKY
mmetsp:Transcript_74488/g.139111  ORF Transcript_74488/g.139111 Transcript_74488/m.139111 type:complete len:271 (-) Transcript_74488:60-872(-)